LLIGEALTAASRRKKKWRGSAAEAEEEQEVALESIADEHEALEQLVTETLELWNSVDVRSDSRVAELQERAGRMLGKRRPFHWVLEFPEVFSGSSQQQKGFNAIIGNPPFLGGTRLEPALGTDYRAFLVETLAGGIRGLRGAADLCSYFFIRVVNLLSAKGYCGLIATNSIAQGDSAIVGLERIVADGAIIYRATSSKPWPGAAATEISQIWLAKGEYNAEQVLDGLRVTSISPYLSEEAQKIAAQVLDSNLNQAFEGAKSAGTGFIISDEEAIELLQSSPENREVVKRYLGGEDVNTHPEHKPSRWIINFRDFPLNREAETAASNYVAQDFPECLSIVEARVKPERLNLDESTSWNRGLRERWWQFGLWRPTLVAAIADCSRVLVSSRVTGHHNFTFVPTDMVYSDRLVVIARDDWASFAIISSTIHGEWAHRPGATTLKKDLNYLPTWAYATFVFPILNDAQSSHLSNLGESYYVFRRQLMLTRQEGMTKTYNRFHNLQTDALIA
jgi:hypothetical protein